MVLNVLIRKVAINVCAPRDRQVIRIRVDASSKILHSKPTVWTMKIALQIWLVCLVLVLVHALVCYADRMPIANRKIMLPGADVELDLQKDLMVIVFHNAHIIYVDKMLYALLPVMDQLVNAHKDYWVIRSQVEHAIQISAQPVVRAQIHKFALVVAANTVATVLFVALALDVILRMENVFANRISLAIPINYVCRPYPCPPVNQLVVKMLIVNMVFRQMTVFVIPALLVIHMKCVVHRKRCRAAQRPVVLVLNVMKDQIRLNVYAQWDMLEIHILIAVT